MIHRVDDFTKIVRRNVGGHTNSDALRTVYQQVGEPAGENYWFLELTGVVVDEVNSENSFKDASANLTTLDSNKINSFVTSIDSSGEFKFDVDLEKGKYLLEIQDRQESSPVFIGIMEQPRVLLLPILD